MCAKSRYQWRDAAAPDKGDHDVYPISGMNFRQKLMADARLPWRIGQ